MTPRTFKYTFDDDGGTSSDSAYSIDLEDISQAATFEILQTDSLNLPIDLLLEKLLVPDTAEFLFKRRLGEAREVQVALSGLLGRFVARAYFSRSTTHPFHAWIQTKLGPVQLDSGITLHVRRHPRGNKGDLPDWIAVNLDTQEIGIVEAKGSHDIKGTDAVLKRAYNQTSRIRIVRRKQRERQSATVKRFAMVTRWGIQGDAKLLEPLIAVRDPIEKGDLQPSQLSELAMAFARRHYATLLRGMGYEKLGNAIWGLTVPTEGSRSSQKADALTTLQREVKYRISQSSASIDQAAPALVAVVNGLGEPLARRDFSKDELEMLGSIDRRAKAISVSPEVIGAVIEGNWQYLGSSRVIFALQQPPGRQAAWDGTKLFKVTEKLSIDPYSDFTT